MILFWGLTLLSTAFAFAIHADPALEPAPETSPPEKAEAGVIYILDGVGGVGHFPRAMEAVVEECEVPYQARQHYWSHGYGRWYKDLKNEDNVSLYAEALADSVIGYKARNNDKPVFIVARSGGTAVALEALKLLPEDSVEKVVLLSSGLSPQYDIAPSLPAVRTEMVSFWSQRDGLVLGMGTKLFGTLDGKKGNAAGRVGFELEDDELPKLRQVGWSSEMTRSGNLGTHLGSSAQKFLRQYVIPLLDAQNEDCLTAGDDLPELRNSVPEGRGELPNMLP